MNKVLTVIFILTMIFVSHSWSEGPSHGSEEHHEEAGPGAHDDHDEHGEANPNIGHGKGIVEADPEKGFKISSEAFKNFEINMKTVNDPRSLVIPKEAVFSGLLERNIYRFRDGFFKRIDFQTRFKSGSEITISSSYLKPGDQIVVSGLGFLRIVELAAYGGVSDSHSH